MERSIAVEEKRPENAPYYRSEATSTTCPYGNPNNVAVAAEQSTDRLDSDSAAAAALKALADNLSAAADRPVH